MSKPLTRILPNIPAPESRVPLLIDTDAGCENDDQYAIALALHLPQRFDIKGFVATFFRGSPDSIPEAVEEITNVLTLSGMSDRYPVVPGGEPLHYTKVGNGSAGAELIIETAKQQTPENPLWVAVLGPTTNTASAILQCPEIASRLVVLFHGRTRFWPMKAWNNNVDADLRATQALFRSSVPLVLFDTGTYLRIDNEVTRARLGTRGEIGAYLQDTREAKPYRKTLKKAFFDLGDVAWLADPALGEAEQTDVPDIGNDTFLDWKRTFGPAWRVYQVDTQRTWELLFSAMETAYPAPSPYTPRPDRVRLYPETARAEAAARREAAAPRPERRVPPVPDSGRKLPLLIDTDVGTEIDDQYAMAMALACPDRFDLRAITGEFFHDEADSPDECVRAAKELLALAGMEGLCPIARGCAPLAWESQPVECEAVDLIIREAAAHSARDPLWIVALGPVTNIASAVLAEPDIADCIVLVFHARCRHWDLKFSSYNALQDLRAARVVMHSRIPLILFDAGTYLTLEMQVTEDRLAPCGELGRFLHAYRSRKPYYRAPEKGFFDLADLAWLCEPDIGEWQQISAPDFGSDTMLSFSKAHGQCLRVHQVDNRRARELFLCRMAESFGGAP